MKKNKVCHMTSAHPAGDVRIFHKECVSLASAGYEVYLVQRGESGENNGVHIVGVGEIPESRRKRMTEGARRVYEAALALDCDIYHLHDPELLPYGRKLKKHGKKVIFDSHEDTADSIMEKDYIPMPVRKMISGAYSRFERSVCEEIDAVVTVTPSQTEYFEKINPTTVEVRNYPILSGSYIEPSFGKKAIAFAGGISAQWNHHVIIKALEKLEDCSYVLFGSPNPYLESLKSLPGWSKVDYRGRIPHKEVALGLSECMIGAALLAPGRNTAWKRGTMGNTKIFEEMMAGLPIVCTDFDLWKEFVDRYECGICIDPTNEDELVEAVRTLSNDPEKARKLYEQGN